MVVHFGGRGPGHLSRSMGGDRPVLSLPFYTMTPAEIAAAGVTFSRASTATYVGSDGLIATAAVNTPRLDYDPATLDAKGLLIEEARTNLLTYSQEFDNAAWAKNNCTVTANAGTAPDGTNTLGLVTATSSGEIRVGRTSGLVSALTTYTFSIFGKYGNSNGRYLWFREFYADKSTCFDLFDGGVEVQPSGVTASVVDFGSGLYRCIVTLTTPAAAVVVNQQHWVQSASPSNVAGGVLGGTSYLWGAQCEAGAFPTSYIPTTSATVTRAADIASMTGTDFSDWFNQSEGTFVVEAKAPAINTTSRALDISNNTTNELIALVAGSTSHLYITDGGALQSNIDAGTFTANAYNKLAAAYEVNNFGACIDGGTVATDTSGTLPSPDRIYLGSTYAGANHLNGHIKSLKYYNTRLPNTQLVSLTS